MKNKISYQRKIIGVEQKLGFLYVPAEVRELLPDDNCEIDVFLEGKSKPEKKAFNADHNRIFGLIPFYKAHKLEKGDLLNVEVTKEYIRIEVGKTEVIEDTEEFEREDFIDISGLSSQAKGNIGEDRVKEIILMYSQGLLNVFKPVIDDRGIDLIVLKEGIYNPIYIQVKSRFNVHKRNRLIINLKGNTFKAHHSYFVVGVYFDHQTLEIGNKILFIPSNKISQLGVKLSSGDWRITVSMKNGLTTGKYKDLLISKEEFVNKLLEKIDALHEVVK